MSTTSSGAAGRRTARTPYAERRVSTETKASYKTTELAVYVLAVIGILVASAVVDNGDADNITGFDARQAWTLITYLTIGYLISRGLAKSGSREFYDDDPADRRDRHDDDNYGSNAGRRSAVSSAAHPTNPTTGSTTGTDTRTTGSL